MWTDEKQELKSLPNIKRLPSYFCQLRQGMMTEGRQADTYPSANWAHRALHWMDVDAYTTVETVLS